MYPKGYEPRLFIAKAVAELGHEINYAPPLPPDNEGRQLPGFSINGQPVIYLLDNRMPENDWQNVAAKQAIETHNALVCCAQKVDALKHGFRWLPLAATPDYIYEQPRTEIVPRQIAFVGYLNDMPRKSIFERIQQDYDCNIASGVFGDKAVAVYVNAQVGLNVTAFYGSQFAYDLNMRVFEIPACGTCLVTPRVPGMVDLGFRTGVHCIMYNSIVELTALLDVVLANSEFREDVARGGRRLVADKHQYSHRAQQLVGWLNE